MDVELRADRREFLALQVTLPGNWRGITRDVGPGGLYLMVPTDCKPEPQLSLQFDWPEAGLRFSAIMDVIRIEPGPNANGWALGFTSTRLVPLASSAPVSWTNPRGS